eukprot:gene9103-1406_t
MASQFGRVATTSTAAIVVGACRSRGVPATATVVWHGRHSYPSSFHNNSFLSSAAQINHRCRFSSASPLLSSSPSSFFSETSFVHPTPTVSRDAHFFRRLPPAGTNLQEHLLLQLTASSDHGLDKYGDLVNLKEESRQIANIHKAETLHLNKSMDDHVPINQPSVVIEMGFDELHLEKASEEDEEA